jgi:hypothetical protein
VCAVELADEESYIGRDHDLLRGQTPWIAQQEALLAS